MNTRTLLIVPALLPFALASACGGDSKPPPNTADTADTTAPATPSDTASTAAPSTAPAADAPAADAPAAKAAAAEAKPAETYTIPVAAAKFTPDKAAKGWKPIEIKDDGSVMRMNKVYMNFVKNQLEDDKGKAFFTVTKEGAVSMGDKPYGKFDEKDALVIIDGGTITVADDGTVKLLEHDGKPSKAKTGKFDNGKGKRTGALLIAMELLLTNVK